jgi:hypothetical protein
MPIRRIKNIFNFELCRNCEHYFLSHTDVDKKPGKCIYMAFKNFTLACKCAEFLPKENLKYLEYLYDKQNI